MTRPLALAALLLLPSLAHGAVTIPFPLTAPPSPAADSATVTLTWTAVGDDGMLGTADRYQLLHNELMMTLVKTPKPAGAPESLSWQIGEPTTFRLRAVDEASNAAPWSNAVHADPGTGADEYLCTWQDAYSGDVVLKSAWGGPAGFEDGYRVPREPGTPDTVWIVFTESVPQMGFLEVTRVRGAAWTGPVYAGHLATFTRADTLSAWRQDEPQRHRWAPPQLFPGRSWFWTGVQRLPHDARASRLVTQSVVQWNLRERICELFDCYGMAGTCLPCDGGTP